jgi:hypothetical protein
MTRVVSIAQSGSNNVTMRNRIINGGMVIDQRNAGGSLAISNAAEKYCLDRYAIYAATGSGHTVQQSSTAPAGFTTSMLVTIGTGGSPASGNGNYFYQAIEGYNMSDFGFGAAGASTVTLSFWVRSSLTGQFSGAVANNGVSRSYPFTYTISSANTWEYKTVTIAGDTTGTWNKTNSVGCYLWMDLGSGSTYQGTANAWSAADKRCASGSVQLVATSGATLYITGVQLEAGTTATPFEQRLYGTELALCQRYARTIGNGLSGVGASTTAVVFNYAFENPMRASPTASITDTSIFISDQYSADITSSGSTITVSNQSSVGGRIGASGFSGITQGRFYSPVDNTNGSVFLLSAEL